MRVAQEPGRLNESGHGREECENHHRDLHGRSRPLDHMGLRLAEKSQEDHPKRVDRSQKRAEYGRQPENHAASSRGVGVPDDQSLAVETRRHQRQARERAAGNRKRPKRNGQLFAQAPHLEHAVFVVAGFDDDAGAQKEQSFEKGVGHEMKDRGRPGPHAERQEHVTDLADGRKRQRLLDVPLRHGAESCDDQRGRADHGHGEFGRG